MKILITGVHGFVGSNLLEALPKEHTIYGLDIISPTKEGVKFTFSWDVLDKDEIPAVDAIIHLAGKAHDTKNQTVSDVYFKVNTGLTQKVFDYFLAHDSIKKFVFFSTAKAAAEKAAKEAAEKAAAEKAAKEAAARAEAAASTFGTCAILRTLSKCNTAKSRNSDCNDTSHHYPPLSE